MVVMLSIRGNLGIVDSWIDLRRSDIIAMHEGVLGIVEKAHRRQRSSRRKTMEVRCQGMMDVELPVLGYFTTLHVLEYK